MGNNSSSMEDNKEGLEEYKRALDRYLQVLTQNQNRHASSDKSNKADAVKRFEDKITAKSAELQKGLEPLKARSETDMGFEERFAALTAIEPLVDEIEQLSREYLAQYPKEAEEFGLSVQLLEQQQQEKGPRGA